MADARLPLDEVHLKRLAQILFRCLEEVGSTKAALYLDATGSGACSLVAQFGWPRGTALPVCLDEALVRWVQRERRCFTVTPAMKAPELAGFGQGPEGPRFLVAPIYDHGEWQGLLIQRDKGRGEAYDLHRDEARTLSICQEVVAVCREAQAPSAEPVSAPPADPLPFDDAALPVVVPAGEALGSLVEPVPEAPAEALPATVFEVLEGFQGTGTQAFQAIPREQDKTSRNLDEPPRVPPVQPRPGIFMLEQRNFFWQVAELLFQALPLHAVALWMDEQAEIRPLLTYSREPLSLDLKQQILAHATYHLPQVTQRDLRILSRAAWMERPSLGGAFRSYLPVAMVVEGGGQDLLLLFRLDEKPFTQREQELVQGIARLLGIHLQEGRLHERYHRAFLSVSHRILSTLDGGAPNLEHHSLQTARMARNFAVRCELGSAEVEAVSIAAILHDVGTYLLEPDLLSKPDLSPEDLAEIRTHPVLASTFLKDFQFPFDVLTIIRHHHERWDGSGYPDGLAGEAIPLGSRIISLVEAYEVMSSGTPFKAAKPIGDILAELRREAGRQFDPRLAHAFADYLQAKSESGMNGLGGLP